MTLLIVLLTSVIVWLNRGLYDPSVPVLVGFFIYWSAQTVLDQDHFKEVKSYGFLIPWIFAILFFFRNDLLYVEAAKKPLLYGLRFCPFLILVADAVLKRMHPLRFRWVGLGLLCGMLLLVPFLSPEPFIDVFLSDRLAAHYLLLGSNPYSQIYPDIYKNHYDYHPGFLYWPGALYLQTASELILRDVRFALILSWIGCVFLLRNRGIYALMWLTLPFLQFALEQAWVDPMIAVGGALALYGLRKDQTIFWILGVVCAATVKQYGFIIGFFSVLYYIRMKGYHATLKPVLGMMLGFVLVLLPFVLWNWTDDDAKSFACDGERRFPEFHRVLAENYRR